jgi:hypothetical protein
MNFDKNLRGLVKICREIIRSENSSSILPENENISMIIKYLNRYEDSFNYGPLDIHRDFFLDLYERFRSNILSKNGFTWVDENTVTLCLGAGSDKPSKNAKIMLSAFYHRALKLVEKLEKELEGCPDSAWEEKRELNYPNVLMLYLHRIFLEVCPDADKSTLDFIVKGIENDLGIVEKAEPSLALGGMAGIVKMASTMMKSMGIQVPTDAKMPSDADIGNVFANLINNPKTQETISSLFKDIGGCKDIGQAGNLIVNKMKDGQMNQVFENVAGIIKQGNIPNNADIASLLGGNQSNTLTASSPQGAQMSSTTVSAPSTSTSMKTDEIEDYKVVN